MKVYFYNTLTKQKEEFKPVNPPKVGMYVCGPTVYDYFHIGNARPFIIFDVLRRYLEHIGYEVIYVQNFTDIDDKMIKRANQMGISVKELAEIYIKAYFEDADALGIKRATYHPKATEHIKEMIELIETLIKRGYAYVVDGDVYFDISKFKDYGKLSGQSIEELMAGARIEVDPRKKNPLDFALWKAKKEGEPYWESPWGQGRPGWHIECSAMSIKYIGETVDIHCGGSDLIFPHHENEIAQSEAATGKQFVKYWLHNGYLLINEEKMSKSLGNFLTAREARKHFKPEAIRLFMLSAHYRSQINFSEDNLKQATSGVERLQTCWLNLKEAESKKSDQNNATSQKILDSLNNLWQEYNRNMSDDFNTAKALGTVFEIVKVINTYITQTTNPSEKVINQAKGILAKVDEIMGIINVKSLSKTETIDEEIQKLIKEREEARKQKDWEKADKIRDILYQKGIILEDTPTGTRWRYKS